MFSFSKLKDFFHKYERMLSASTLVLGFMFDYFTLKRVDYWLDNVLIVLYLFIAGASILIGNLYEAGRIRGKFTSALHEFIPFIFQFVIGGLFSAFTIFYSKSTSFVGSALFVGIMFALMIGNEFFKHRYSKLGFQMSIYFLALFSFFIYLLPVVFRQMGAGMFLLSGVTSLCFFGLFIFIVAKFAPLRYRESYRPLFISIALIFSIMNIFYFTNIIPPIPLSLKYGNVFHSVEKKLGGGYEALREQEEGWLSNFNKKIHLVPGKEVYVFSSVFSPAELDISITHNWQYFDEQSGRWISVSRIIFPIFGGRNEGYRGFSKKSNIFTGKWRVDVETERGQVIGRIRFDIEKTMIPLSLQSVDL